MTHAATEIPLYDVEDHLWSATRDDGRPRALVYEVPETVVVLGRGSKVDAEVRADRCDADGVPLRRRRGGGCAVVLDPGNLIVAASLPVEGLGRNLEHFARLDGLVIDALSDCGVEGASQAGISDLVVGDRKFGGTCIYRTRGVLHFAASLLVDAELDRIERYLPHPPREPDYRGGRRHGDFLTNLADLPGAPSAAEIVAGVKKAFTSFGG